jgi:hypothetical protein
MSSSPPFCGFLVCSPKPEKLHYVPGTLVSGLMSYFMFQHAILDQLPTLVPILDVLR